ncbi:hypothetical protein COCNU_14G012750 [Cocos nucifera]|uniref:Uncharacterized protein n=1 Tax=Cocos nucifera TaxID=13894 RepID=A0A8K0IW66_COCNU|nr:hypothetical protein COCNU_14G012750 [Cocos nucifera]
MNTTAAYHVKFMWLMMAARSQPPIANWKEAMITFVREFTRVVPSKRFRRRSFGPGSEINKRASGCKSLGIS